MHGPTLLAVLLYLPAAAMLIAAEKPSPLRTISPELGEAEGRRAQLQSIAFDRTSERFAVAATDAIRIYRVRDGELLQTINWEGISTKPILQFLPDGEQLIVAGGLQPVQVYRVETGELIREYGKQTLCVAFSGDGSTLLMKDIGGPDRHGNGYGVYNLPEIEQKYSFEVPPETGGPYVASLSFNGKLAALTTMTGGKQHDKPHIFIVRCDTGETWSTWKHDPVQPQVAISANGRRLVSRSQMGEMRFYDVVNRREADIPPIEKVGYAGSGGLKFSPDNTTVAFANTLNELLLINFLNGEIVATIDRSQTGGMTDYAFSHDGKLLAQASRTEIHLWRIEDFLGSR